MNSKQEAVSSKQITKTGIFFLFAVFCLLFTPKLVSAATLFVSPSSGSFSVGQTFSVSVRTNTQGEATNTAEARIQYSTDTLELVSVSQGSTFYLPAPGSPSKGSGTAYFGGGVPTPGYTGGSGLIGTMTFRARALGTGTVSVSSGKVLLNDGLGTNALSGSSGARFTISPPPVSTPQVSSTTHPNPEGWGNASTVQLSWTRPTGAYGFSFELDQNADTTPDNELDTTITTTKTYEDLKDGVWYFHIKARGQAANSGFGNTVHYRIGVDTQKPLLFDIVMVGQSDLNDVTRTPTITFEAQDETSGIDHYDIYFGDELVLAKAESPYTFSKLENGPHIIRVVAFDKAGHDRKAELPIIVAGPAPGGFFHQTFTMPIYVVPLINMLFLLLISLMLWLIFRKRHKKVSGNEEVAEIQAEIDQSLEQLKQQINEKLLSLSAKSSSELLAKEEKVAKQVNVSVTKTRKSVDKKLNNLGKKLIKQKAKNIE